MIAAWQGGRFLLEGATGAKKGAERVERTNPLRWFPLSYIQL